MEFFVTFRLLCMTKPLSRTADESTAEKRTSVIHGGHSCFDLTLKMSTLCSAVSTSLAITALSFSSLLFLTLFVWKE